MTTTTRRYTTRNDAAREVREQLADANAALLDLATDQAWREQQTPAEAVSALSARGVDCEGYEEG